MHFKRLFTAAAAFCLFASLTPVQAEPAYAGITLPRDDAAITKIDYYYHGYYHRHRHLYRRYRDDDDSLLDIPGHVLGGIAGLVNGVFGAVFDDGPYYSRPYYVSPYYGSPYRGRYGYYYSPYNGDGYYVGAHYSVRREYEERYYSERKYYSERRYYGHSWDYQDDGWRRRRYDYSYRRYEGYPSYSDRYSEAFRYYEASRYSEASRYPEASRSYDYPRYDSYPSYESSRPYDYEGGYSRKSYGYGELYYGDRYAGRVSYYGAYDDD